jgi:uncharacterized protein YdgA (DUF945 family)
VSRRIWIPLIIVVLLLVYPAAAWLIGLNAESQWNKREQLLHQQYPVLEVVKHEYHRGVYTSTEDITYRYSGSLNNNLQRQANALQWSDLQVSLHNTIHHGPWPQLRTFAPATVDTEIILPQPLRDKLVELLGNKAQLTIHTQIDWTGGSTTELRSPAFDDARIKWRGLEGTTAMTADLKSAKANLSAPGLSVTTGQGELGFDNLQGRSEQQMQLEGFNTGKGHLTLDSLHFADKVGMQHLTLQAESALAGQSVGVSFGLGIDSLHVQEYNLTQVGYEVRVTHLDAPALVALSKAFNDARANSGDPKAAAAKAQQVMGAQGLDLLTRDPVLEIPRIGFSMPEGQLLLSLKASAPGLTRDELQAMPGAWQMALVKHMDVTADLRVDKPLLDKLLASSGKADQVNPQLQALEQQGFIKVDGNTLTSHMAFQGGRLTVNGQSFPPTGGTQPPQSPKPPPHPTPRPKHR